MALHLFPIALSFYKKFQCSKHRMGKRQKSVYLKDLGSHILTLRKKKGRQQPKQRRKKIKGNPLLKKDCVPLD
jgi:hypothetical protein